VRCSRVAPQYTSLRKDRAKKIMPNALAEPPRSESVRPESLTVTEPAETLAGLSQRVAVLEARLARKRPDSRSSAYWIGRRTVPRLTRPDRCPFGWKPSGYDPMKLVPDPAEQQTIWFLIEAAQNSAMGPRALCRWLDSHGRKRRGGKPWAGAHGLIRAILRRHSAETPVAAKARVLERIAAMRARAADR
jgi:hypothetical protein